MTVKELKEKLNDYNDELIVVRENTNDFLNDYADVDMLYEGEDMIGVATKHPMHRRLLVLA